MNTTMPLLPEQKENAKHGELLFPIQKYTTHLSGESPMVIPHWHEEAEFTLITEGSCTYQIQLENYEVKEGDLVFVAPLQLHSITRNTEEMISDTYVFHMNFLGAGTSDICGLRYLTPLTKQTLIPPVVIPKEHPAYEDGLRLFHTINHAWQPTAPHSQTQERLDTAPHSQTQEYLDTAASLRTSKQPGYELTIKSSLLSLIALLLPYCVESSAIPQLQTEHTKKIKTALEYIALHYTEELSVADVAAACYFSEYYFMRFFKKHVGMSCVDYIKKLRLEKAVDLFEKGGLSILDVSLAAGFRNLPYFYREFKKKYGVTPKQFILNLMN